MSTLPAPVLSETAIALAIVFIFLVPLAAGGLALINSGLGRSRSAAHMMMSSLSVLAIAALVYFVCGFAWQGYIGEPAHFFTLGVKPWNWIAAGPFFMRHLESSLSAGPLAALLGMLAVGLAALIPLGAGSDRWSLSAICWSTVLMAAWTFPLFAHWVWGGGWLAQLGANYGLGEGFIDAGGASTIHTVGGLTALSIAWIIGPRRGKYTREGMPSAIPGHNTVLVLFGCLLTLVGWFALNSAGAILFMGIEPGRVVLIALNTALAAGSAGLTAAVITRTRFGRPDASLIANGWVGGLVAISAGCPFYVPAESVVIGVISAALVLLSVDTLELRLGVDDPSGSISAHAVAGIWGILAVGVLGHIPNMALEAAGGTIPVPHAGNSGQWLAQVVGIATLLGFVLPLAYGLNWLLNRFHPQRVGAEGERQGMDLYELGAGAYPEFITHSDEFTQRKF